MTEAEQISDLIDKLEKCREVLEYYSEMSIIDELDIIESGYRAEECLKEVFGED